MPSGWIVGSFVIKSSLVVLIGSLLIALLYYFFYSPFSKKETKKHIDEISNVFIGLAIAIIVGKIITHFPTFLKDPISILAYPSDSKAFYIGILIIIGYCSWKVVKSYDHFQKLFFAFISIFITASLLYEFVMQIFGNGNSSILYLFLLFALFLFVQYVPGKLHYSIVGQIAFLLWNGVQFALTLFTPTYIFTFIVDSWFYLLLFMSGLFLFFNERRWNK